MESIYTVFNSYAEIFFLRQTGMGIVLCAMTFLFPYVALGGLVTVLSAYLFARFIHIDHAFLNQGFYTYNPLLVGLSIGYLFKLNLITFIFLIFSGILTLVITVLLNHIFATYFRLPILSLPFVILSSLAYLAATRYSNLSVNGIYHHPAYLLFSQMPLWITGYFKSFGAIFFMPNTVCGMVIVGLILFYSRILWLLSILGYYTGTAVTAILIGSWSQAFSNVNHFNYILIAMVIGGIFLIPSPRSYVIAMIAVAVSTVLLDSAEILWSSYGIPVFTLPFNLVSLTFLYVLGVIGYPLLALKVKPVPEETLDTYLSDLMRFKYGYRSIALPFAGKWTVWQGFSGKWTHQGSFKHALDFIITDRSGKSYQGQGEHLSDFYCFGKPVFSPVRGRVIDIVDHLPDNPPGAIDKTNNWGNYIIIEAQAGFFVEISHLCQQSAKVSKGDWIEQGMLLALCGNSGYSPQPHLHVQVQEYKELGSLTIPFSIASYIEKSQYRPNDVPQEGNIVEPLNGSGHVKFGSTYLLDDQLTFDIYNHGEMIDRLNMMVKMGPDGSTFFDSGKAKLYFGQANGTFYFYGMDGKDFYLKQFFKALPSYPVTCREQIFWQDNLPVGLIADKWKKAFWQFISSFYHEFPRAQVTLTCTTPYQIKGTIRSRLLQKEEKSIVNWDEYGNIRQILVGHFLFQRRIDDQKTV